ncbi:MAG: T9SS C-terminal target domain-containing protein, partial [Bacteroidetes bacterium]
GDDPKFKPIIDLGLKPTSPDSTQITVRWQKADTRNGEWVDMDTTIKDHTNIDSLLEKSNLADTATFSRDTVEIDTTSKFVLKGYALEKTTFFRRILSVKDCADTSNVVRIEVLDITKAEAAKADAAFLYNFYSNYGFGGWDRNRPISEWAGVVLENGRLVGLDLHLTNLTGEVPNFPPLIANSLKYVNFSNNQLSGKIPDHVAEWANLEYLDLSGNDLEGEVPESLGSLVKLKTIYLAHNRLTSIPEKLFDNLTELRSLFLNNNQLSVLPKNINRLKSLEFLNLGNNLLREIPEEISELSNLQLLYFNNNRLTKLPLSLEKLTNLKGLFLQNNLLTDLISFAKLESLEQLDVHGNALDFADLEIFANKGGRTSLNVSYIPQALFGNIQDIFAIAETRQFLNVNTAGTANKYQWYKDDKKINIASATTNQLEIFRASQADQGVYKVLVTNSKVPNLTLTSQEIRLTVSCNTFAVNVSVQGSANFCENTNSEPVLTATLLPNVSYQWTFDGKNMSGENTNILKATESGKYAVLVEDKAKCVAISNEILVQKLTSPKVIIKIEGKDRDILQADFFGNTQIQSYQWFKNDELLATKTDFISAEGTASYYLKAIDQNGCVGISNLITFVPTSLENEFLAKEIKVYPNPSSGIYQIESPSPISLVVYNALGQKLDVNSAKTENNYLLDLSAMPSGIYLLEIKDAKGFCIKKLIKN